MSRVGRLSGAIIAETGGRYFLVGDLKEPCDFEAIGFESPGEIEPLIRPYVELKARKPFSVTLPCLEMSLEGEALPAILAQRFLIERNGSVSDRLWRMVANPDGAHDPDATPKPIVQAQWLIEMPSSIWSIIRGSVLKCT